MKIVWFTHRDIEHPQSGGAERTIYEVGRRLVDQGIEVAWISCRFSDSKAVTYKDGIQLVRSGDYLSSHLRVRSVVRSLRPDVIVDDLGHVVPWCSERLTSNAGTVFFRHLHRRTLWGQVPVPLAAVLSRVERNYRWIYPCWTFVTESARGVLDLEELGIHPTRISRIPPGVDLDLFHPGEKFPTPTIVYFGGFREYKRPWIAVEVARRMVKLLPSVRLLMIGDGPSLRLTEALVQSQKVRNIEFLGRLRADQLADVVSQAWLNVHTSIAEGWGYSILEAAAAGTPTVGFSVPGVSESLELHSNGLTVPDNDIEAMVAAAFRLLTEAKDWKLSARHYAEQFTWELATNRWRAHLESVASRNP